MYCLKVENPSYVIEENIYAYRHDIRGWWSCSLSSNDFGFEHFASSGKGFLAYDPILW